LKMYLSFRGRVDGAGSTVRSNRYYLTSHLKKSVSSGRRSLKLTILFDLFCSAAGGGRARGLPPEANELGTETD
jgi:hypothetical protein